MSTVPPASANDVTTAREFLEQAQRHLDRRDVLEGVRALAGAAQAHYTDGQFAKAYRTALEAKVYLAEGARLAEVDPEQRDENGRPKVDAFTDAERDALDETFLNAGEYYKESLRAQIAEVDRRRDLAINERAVRQDRGSGLAR